MQNVFIWLKVLLHSSKHWWLWKEPVVMSGNWNVRQGTSQQVFQVTTFCTHTCFQSFSPLINCIVHHAVLKFSSWRNKTLPQLVRVADWYSIHVVLQHAPDVVIYRVEVLLASNTSGLMNWGVSWRKSSTVSRVWCAGALSCWKTNAFRTAMLRITSSSFCISNTSVARWFLLQAQQSGGWYGRVWILWDSHQSAIRTSCESVLLWHGLNFSTARWNRNITFSHMKKFSILQGSAVTFFRCGGQGVTVCFLLR